MKTIEYKGILFRMVPDYPAYAVSQCGKILDRSGFMPREYDDCGRPKINFLCAHGGGYSYIDRLVWRVWVKDNLFKKYIYQEDRDFNNCQLSNLRVKYLTRKYRTKLKELPSLRNKVLHNAIGKVIYPPKLITIDDLSSDDVLKAPTTSSTLTKKHKLCELQVEEIVALLASKELTQQDIANKYEVSIKTISRIKNKKTWKFKL